MPGNNRPKLRMLLAAAAILLLGESCFAETRVTHESHQWSLENPRVRVTLDAQSGTLVVLEKSSGNEWRQAEQTAQKGSDPKFRNVQEIADINRGIEFEGDYGSHQEKPVVLSVRLSLPDEGADLFVETDMKDREMEIPNLPFLEPLVHDSPTGVLVVADYCDGHLISLDMNPFPRRWFSASRLDMPWVGLCDLAEGFGYMLLVETSDDASIEMRTVEVGGRELAAPRVVWNPSKKQFRYPRRLMYHFIGDGGYVAMSKRYRAYAREHGFLVPFSEKMEKNPNISRLFGAPDVWGNATLAFAQEAKAAGVEKMIIHGRTSPADMRAINELGYLTSEYDNYTDVRPIEPGKDIDSNHDHIRESVVLNADGERMKAWLTFDKKTQFMKRCPSLWLQTAKIVVPRVLERHPYLGRFIDVTTAENLYECYDPKHPLTRTDKRKCGVALLSYVRSLRLVMGGEHGIWWSVPYLDYIEGMMSGGSYSWPAGHLIRPKSKEQEFTSAWGSKLGKWDEYEKWGIGHANRVPLWQLVFHDCVISTWYWGDASDFLLEAAPEVTAKKDAFNILYGTIPLMWANKEGAWQKSRDTFLKTYRNTCKLHEVVAAAEMLSHDFVTPDRAVQRTRFSDGTEVVVNFGEAIYTAELSGKKYLLPQNGFAVKGPRIEQSLAIVDGRPVTTIRSGEFQYSDAERIQLQQEPNTWVKRSPLPDTPPSPQLGYEGACALDSIHRVLIRYGGHNQGGGGEQGSEVWTFDPFTAKWELKEPNISPPGVCCDQQNVFDPVSGRYIRFPSFSGSHGWQWWREIYLNDSTVWVYDLASNLWRNLRPLPAPHVSPLRCASWDSDAQVIVLFGGEGNREGTLVYDPYSNTWTRMNPPNEPPFRSGGNMVYDAARKVHILFGAQFSDDPHTWAYDLRKNEWRDLGPATLPPTDHNDAVLAYNSLNRAVVALIKVTEGEEENARHRLETWAFDTAKNEWRKMNPPQEPDPSGNRARVLCFAPELGLTILENCTHPPHAPREQQIWTYRFADSAPESPTVLLPAKDLKVTTTADGATLTWEASPSPNVTSYIVYRGTGEHPWLVHFQQVGTAGAAERTYRDSSLSRGTVYFYTVRASDGRRLGPESMKVRTQPPIVENAVVSVASAHGLEVTWTPPAAEDIVGYHVERAAVEVWSEDQLKRLKSRLRPLPNPSVGAVRHIGSFVRLTAEPMRATKFLDTIDLAAPRQIEGTPVWENRLSDEHLDREGKPYRFAVFAYRIRSVNALGIESGPSPFLLTIPSAPKWVFSKEEGTTCHLKWARNPEKNLKGYRVYRLDGRWDSDSISRLTDEPLDVSSFGDKEAGQDTRRYHIVAVDALGQEGFPSSPVWYDREWKRYYAPFTTEWHQ